MTRITIKAIEPAADDNHPTIITDATGAKMSGFDTKLRDLHPGDVIDVEIKPKGKFNNIVSFKVIEQTRNQGDGSTGSPRAGNDNPAETYTRRVEMEIDARYRTVALECAAQFVAGENATEKTVLGAADEFYAWLTVGAGFKPARINQQGAGTDETGGKKAAAPATEADREFDKLGRVDAEKTPPVGARHALPLPEPGTAGEPGKSFVDWGIIGNNLTTLARQNPAVWGDEPLMLWMDRRYKATIIGKTVAAKSALLNEGEAKDFTRQVREAVAGKGRS